MDEFTYAHLDVWIERQFPVVYCEGGASYRELMEVMRAQYASDPALYADVGWWRCYDDATGGER